MDNTIIFMVVPCVRSQNAYYDIGVFSRTTKIRVQYLRIR